VARGGKLSGLKVERARGPAVLRDGGGLLLRVEASGSKRWVYRFDLDGRRREMGLGSYPDIGLAEARQRAAACRIQKADGIDPIEARRVRRQVLRLHAAHGHTFKEAAEEFLSRKEDAWRNPKHRAQWRSTLETYVHPVLGDLPVDAIDPALVMRVLDPIWHTKPETASRVRGRIEAVLDAATVRGWRTGPNPAQWKGNLAHILPARSKVRRVAHHAALPYSEIAAFLAALRDREGMGASALKFAILTAARTGEVIGARWAEINLDERIWTVPAERMKGGREHRVPLSEAAIEVLHRVLPLALLRAGRPDPAAPIFPGKRRASPLSSMAMLNLLRRMGRDDLTTHGFRSTFRDWAAERTSFPAEVAEMALAHAVADKVEAAYRRGDLFQKRRQLMEAWARFCSMPQAGADVLPFRGDAMG
jgi:integrase